MLEIIAEAVKAWRSGTLSDPAVAGFYFLYWQIHLHGDQFAARRNKRDARLAVASCLELLHQSASGADETLADWFSRYQFKGVIGDVPLALAAWLRGEWSLTLTERIPSAMEVLTMQAQGRRPVTLVTDPQRMLRPVLHKPNGFAFLAHDLEHACKFFADAELHRAQRQLFKGLQSLLKSGLLAAYQVDEVFCQKFDYLISDMNSHPMHGLMYLRAILVEAQLRMQGKALNETLLTADCAGIDRIMNSVGLADVLA